MKLTGLRCLEQGISWNSLMGWIFKAEDAAQAKDLPLAQDMLKAAKASADGMKNIFPPVKPIASKVSRMISRASGRLTKKNAGPVIRDELREIRYAALEIYPESKKACRNGKPSSRSRS